MSRIIRGVVHGRTIELAEDLGVADGQQVEVVVKPLGPPSPGAKASAARRGRWRIRGRKRMKEFSTSLTEVEVRGLG